MSYEERINHLKDEFSKSSSKLRMADVEGSHTDYCTKCTVKPIVKEHMCEECYAEHCQWLRELSAPKIDSDQWYTLYESGVRE